MSTIHHGQSSTFLDRIVWAFLWPGEAACNALSIEDADSRLVFRMFINLTVYAKVAGLLVYMLA